MAPKMGPRWDIRPAANAAWGVSIHDVRTERRRWAKYFPKSVDKQYIHLEDRGRGGPRGSKYPKYLWTSCMEAPLKP